MISKAPLKKLKPAYSRPVLAKYSTTVHMIQPARGMFGQSITWMRPSLSLKNPAILSSILRLTVHKDADHDQEVDDEPKHLHYDKRFDPVDDAVRQEDQTENHETGPGRQRDAAGSTTGVYLNDLGESGQRVDYRSAAHQMIDDSYFLFLAQVFV